MPEGNVATHDEQKALADTLGVLRAETLGDRVFELFEEPAFFPELESGNSCFLMGGRGTGKTTLLRCLSYHGQAALRTGDLRSVASWPYFGVFQRVDIGKVRSFSGPEVTVDRWARIFGHYVNLELTDSLLDLVQWVEEEIGDQLLPEAAYADLLASLHASQTEDGRSPDLGRARLALRRARRDFEAGINNIADVAETIKLSMLGSPVQSLVAEMRAKVPFCGKRLFFLIDEYENLLDYQQQVYNTLIKNVWDGCAFKVGVKLLGWRTRSTVGHGEALSSPADYARIEITERLETQFAEFARRVVEGRLRKTFVTYAPTVAVAEMFETISIDEEARRLGVEELPLRFPDPPDSASAMDVIDLSNTLPPLERLFAIEWARGDYEVWAQGVRGLAKGDRSWRRRYNNYSYALLFTIRARKPGRRKYYAGWRTICLLAGANVRYLLDLVSTMINRHLQEGGDLSGAIAAELQTDVAQEVGRKNVAELERDSDDARSLQRLVLSLGRVFEVLAAKPIGFAPEVTQFALPADDSAGPPSPRSLEVARILAEGINAQAFLRLPASKRREPSDARAYDYMLHPVFAPFFVISHRRKRKTEIREDELLGLIQDPKWEIMRLLRRLRHDPREVPLPDQLKLFSAYYE
jgi:hypothetical protein